MKKALLCLLFISTISCKNVWNEDDKEAFYYACTEQAITWAGTQEVAKTYCDCLFTRMNQKYSSESEVLEHLADLATDTGMINCKEEILKRLGK
ncbi:MAG: hypothetical protein K0Q79_2232 [Flavipsychrobacter sp.]|jgi:hypothetical protein|nr:hypothetical protein [Flavipsychrobacter sp.]